MEKKKNTSVSKAKTATKKAPVKAKAATKKAVSRKSVKVEAKKEVVTKEVKKVEKNKKKFNFKGWFNSLTLQQIIVSATIIIAVLLLILICVSWRNTKTKNGSDIVAKINGKKITADDLYTELKSKYGKDYVIDMIDEYIINKEVKTTSDMKEEAASLVDSYKNNYGEQYEQFIQYYGASNDAEFKEIIIKQSKLNTITENYIKKNLTEKEKKAYYESSIVGDIKASHILIAFNYADDATDEEKTIVEEAAKVKAEELITRINNGEDFATLAKEYSEDEGTKENGGDLGFFNKGQMVEAFEKAAYALNINDYTKEPVKSTYGYHIILKTAQKDKPSYEDATDAIEEALIAEKSEDTTIYYKALADLREKYNLKIKDKTIKSEYDTYLEESLKEATE